MSLTDIPLDARGMLSDKHINIGQQLIKHSFPNIGGLQSTYFTSAKKNHSFSIEFIASTRVLGNYLPLLKQYIYIKTLHIESVNIFRY